VGVAQEDSKPDFIWGNVSYFNLSQSESIYYNSVEIKLLALKNQFNTIAIGQDTICAKVSKRTLAIPGRGVRLFVADNKFVKELTDDKEVHGLLKKDVLLGVCKLGEKMLEPNRFVFPVSFNDGFLWNADEDTYMYSYLGKSITNKGEYLRSYEGIGIDLHDARGVEKHWLVAIENSTVVWVEDKNLDEMGKDACVLLKSDSNPDIYYVYNHLYNKTIEVRKGQKLLQGELIGTAWGDQNWGHLQMLVVKSDSIPSYKNRFHNCINFFPQLYELYFKESYSFSKTFTRGIIEFGKAPEYNGSGKNSASYETYLGKGWLFNKWNKTEKVESVSKGEEANVRLRKVLFSGEKAESTNPSNYYDYEVSVANGVYRIRAKVGDLFLPTWQKIEFEGVAAASYSLEAGERKWTNERAIKVTDNKITVRIYIDDTNKMVSGLSEIVFQRAY
jgi:hypothetical protein